MMLSGIGVLIGIILVIVGWRADIGLSPGMTVAVGLFVTIKEILDMFFAK